MATSTIPKQYIVDTVTAPAITVTKGGVGTVTVSASKTGYKPIGILAINKAIVGSGVTNYIVVSNYYISSSEEARATFYNAGEVDRKFTTIFTILYEKSA